MGSRLTLKMKVRRKDAPVKTAKYMGRMLWCYLNMFPYVTVVRIHHVQCMFEKEYGIFFANEASDLSRQVKLATS